VINTLAMQGKYPALDRSQAVRHRPRVTRPRAFG
jgi:hypothetical protein